jgi:hypothetical protein
VSLANKEWDAGMTLEVWSRGTMASARAMVTRRLESGFRASFRLRDLYPDIAASSVYSLQLRAYMPITARNIRIMHSHGQAIVHVAHCMLYATDASLQERYAWHNWTAAPIAKGSSKIPAGVNSKDLHHMHITITCVSYLPCYQHTVTSLCLFLP